MKKKLKEVNYEEIKILEKIKEIKQESNNSYGYIRANLCLRNKGIIVNHKKVLRIMKENNLLCAKFSTRSRKYSSYKGKVGKIANNKLNREFKVEQPNEVWVRDVTEFKILGSDKKVYLSL